MKSELLLNGFQELTEEEAAAVDGGWGIASTWVALAQNITNIALGGTSGILMSTAPRVGGLAYAGGWVGLAGAITNTVLGNVAYSLAMFGL
jgi:hypothetical protein